MDSLVTNLAMDLGDFGRPAIRGHVYEHESHHVGKIDLLIKRNRYKNPANRPVPIRSERPTPARIFAREWGSKARTLYNPIMSPLYPWQNFYVIVGSSAGALTGLQFVVMALIADMPGEPGETETAAAFATPTIVHFVAVLLLAASVVMPWPSLRPAAIVWGLAGLCGFLYTATVTRRMVRQNAYKPVFEDWLCHSILPSLAYLALPAASTMLISHSTTSLFTIAAALLLLLTVGIHNAWDNVTFLVTLRRERLTPPEKPTPTP